MELKLFISETLKQIIEGVQEAQNHIIDAKIDAKINPKDTRSRFESIDFDVAVTTTASNENGINGGIKVASIFNAGANTQSINSEQNASRIKFKVEIQLPLQSNDNKKDIRSISTAEENKSKNHY